MGLRRTGKAVEDRAEMGQTQPPGPRAQVGCSHRRLGERPGHLHPLQKAPALPLPWLQTSSLQRERTDFYVKLSRVWYFAWQPQDAGTSGPSAFSGCWHPAWG